MQHIGSTSVTSLAAKPIIDILIEVPEIEQIDKHIVSFEALGYEALGEYGIAGRRYFRRGPIIRTHHRHAFRFNSHNAKRHLAFRRYLEFHPDIASEYQAVKYKAAEECAGDSSRYCELKNDFVVYHESKALVWVEKSGLGTQK